MAGILFSVTDAGLAAQEAADTGGVPVVFASIGLSNTPFAQSPTLTALPGLFKSITALSGVHASDHIIHLTAYDSSSDAYSATGLGVFLADGTLFGVFSSNAAVLTKVALSTAVVALDIAFTNNASANISFGSALFNYPPATEVIKGVMKIATQARVDATEDATDDDRTAVTPKTLRARLGAFFTSVNAALDAMTNSLAATITAINGRSIQTNGLATGGGLFSALTPIEVKKSTGASIDLGTADDEAVTPLSLRSTTRSFGASGEIHNPDGTIEKWGRASIAGRTSGVAVLFPVAFPNECFTVQLSGASTTQQDNPPGVVDGTINAGSFQSYNWHVGSIGVTWWAKGR